LTLILIPLSSYKWSKPIPFEKDWRAWSAADEIILKEDEILKLVNNRTLIFHDIFGVLGTALNEKKPTNVVTFHSQTAYLKENFAHNEVKEVLSSVIFPEVPDFIPDFCLIKVPKSLELFEFYLSYIALNGSENVSVVASFMTKHFSPNMITIAEKYFENVSQSKAFKKARTIQLTNKRKKLPTFEPIKRYFSAEGDEIVNFKGVFSASKIDVATQLLVQYLPTPKDGAKVLDLACGNGILGKFLLHKNPNIEKLFLVDDFHLAIESAKMNIINEKVNFYCDFNVSAIHEKVDLVVCNPPFHIEHYQTSAIAFYLFRQVKRLLSDDGALWIVVNVHLKYFAILKSVFPKVERKYLSDKFEILRLSLT